MYFSSMPWLCVFDLSIVWIYLYLDCGGSYREPHLLVQQTPPEDSMSTCIIITCNLLYYRKKKIIWIIIVE